MRLADAVACEQVLGTSVLVGAMLVIKRYGERIYERFKVGEGRPAIMLKLRCFLERRYVENSSSGARWM